MDSNLQQAMRSYGGPLTPEQLQVLRDMQGWIDYCISNGFSLKSALGALAHDANGLLADTPFLKPQVSGYAKYRTELEDLTGLADDPDPNADE